MTTKERIVEEALSLFSINGFQGTSVKRIAEAVGIKDSSLYKHFSSKQEILDTIVQTMRQRIESMSDVFGVPADDDIAQAVKLYATFDEEKLAAFSRTIFLFYWKDSYISRFWRMGTIEQFQNPDVYAVFEKLFLEDSIAYQTMLFEEMCREQVFIDVDPSVIAMNFYAPIYFLLTKYANHPEKEEEALRLLDKQVREFYRIYRRRNNEQGKRSRR